MHLRLGRAGLEPELGQLGLGCRELRGVRLLRRGQPLRPRVLRVALRVAADGAPFAKRRPHTQPVELGGDAGPEALQATPTRDVLTPGVERHALRPEPDPRR